MRRMMPPVLNDSRISSSSAMSPLSPIGALAGPDELPTVVLAAHPDLYSPLEELLRSLGAAEV